MLILDDLLCAELELLYMLLYNIVGRKPSFLNSNVVAVSILIKGVGTYPIDEAILGVIGKWSYVTRVQKAAQSLLCVRGTDFNGEDDLKNVLKASGDQIFVSCSWTPFR